MIIVIKTLKIYGFSIKIQYFDYYLHSNKKKIKSLTKLLISCLMNVRTATVDQQINIYSEKNNKPRVFLVSLKLIFLFFKTIPNS